MTSQPATVPVVLNLNGRSLTLDVQPHHTLLAVLRDQVRLTGTKECCAEGECGACTIVLDGRAVNSCLILAVEADGSELLTIEGVSVDGRLSAVQDAFLECGAVQCGFCIPGMIMAATSLLREHPQPSVKQIQEGLAGNLCRCAGYSRIIEAVQKAARDGR